MDRRSSAITPWDLECMLCDETAEPRALPLCLLEEITNNFSDEQEIGRGGFAVVYKGMLENRIVAVKRMSNTYMHEKEFQREVECLMTAKHNNVVRFLGYCADTQGTVERLEGKFVMADVQQRLLCFEYLPKGSLDKYITDTSHGLRWSDRYKIIMGICQGLHYLHQKNIVHLDLKPANILLDGNLVPKITDFGISRCFHEIQSRDITTMAGTFGYLAPESFNNTKVTYRHSYRLDIYSLGVVITEILTGERGYHDVDNVVESWSNMLEKSQCDVQLKQVRVCAEIGVDCIDSNPAKRPDTEHIINRLNEYNEIVAITSQQSVSDSLQLATKVRCLCGSTLLNDNMIKCEDDRCHVWQHMTCVLILDSPTDGVSPEVPPHFYCELCRLSRADPFWVTTGHLLPPVKFMSSGIATDGTSVLQTSEKNFQLSRADRGTIQRSEYDLQVWCILMNDKVQFRMQWPQYAAMEVNGIPVRLMPRPGSQLLGINGRDEGPLITTFIGEGTNKISLRMVDTRTFCFGVRMARPRIIRQVFNLVPREAEGESFEDALTRVRRCLGGGDTTENADSDSDVEVVAESFTVSLRCPNSGSRMETAARFKPCIHMGCFDLDTFVELNQRSRKWQCPICLKNYSLENLIIDPYFNRITSLLRHCSQDVNEVDIKPDGSWRVKGDVSTRELSQWHMPDGTLREFVKPDVENFNEFKIEEGTYDGHKSLKIGIKRRRHKSNEVDDKKPSVVGNHTQNVITFRPPNTFPVSNSPAGSCRDGEDTSVNQGGSMHHSMHIDLSLNRDGHEFDSFPPNFGLTYSTEDTSQQQHNVGDAIFLGYSDKENGNITCPPTVYDNTITHDSGFTFATNGAGFTGRCQEDAGVGTSGLDLISNKSNDFELNSWQMHSSLQLEQGFQFFGNDSDIANTSVGLHSSSSIPPNDYLLHCSVGSEEACVSHVLPVSHNSNEMHGSLVDNPLAFSGDDPSSLPLHEEPSERVNAANGLQSDDWISLTLAAGGGANEESAPASGSNLQQQIQSNEQEAASALASTNSDIHNGANLVFSHPGQARPRSVRPRLCLSIDTDSE